MKSSAEAHIAALQQAEAQKAKLKDAVSHQVNVTTSNFTAELAKLLNRADRDPLTAYLNKVQELDQQFAALLASRANGTNGSNGTSFHIAIMIDPSRIERTIAPDLASFGHFQAGAEIEQNTTWADSTPASANGSASPPSAHEGDSAPASPSGSAPSALQTQTSHHGAGTTAEASAEEGEAGDNVWLPFWPTGESVALVEKNRCRVAVEKLQHKYRVTLPAVLG
jgi:hypothetical protein